MESDLIPSYHGAVVIEVAASAVAVVCLVAIVAAGFMASFLLFCLFACLGPEC